MRWEASGTFAKRKEKIGLRLQEDFTSSYTQKQGHQITGYNKYLDYKK